MVLEISIVEKETMLRLWKAPRELQQKSTGLSHKVMLSKQRAIQVTDSVMLPGPGRDKSSDLGTSSEDASRETIMGPPDHKIRQAQQRSIIKQKQFSWDWGWAGPAGRRTMPKLVAQAIKSLNTIASMSPLQFISTYKSAEEQRKRLSLNNEWASSVLRV